VSTYSLDASNGALTAVTKSAKNGQTDGCWIVLSASQSFAYTANFVSGTISSYAIAAGTPATTASPPTWP
jgi:6-phosphogluconolactonase